MTTCLIETDHIAIAATLQRDMCARSLVGAQQVVEQIDKRETRRVVVALHS